MTLTTLLKEIEKPEQYSFNDLFKIRDALYILYDYDLADVDLLVQILKFINQKKG